MATAEEGSRDEEDDVPLSKRFFQQSRLKSRVRKRKVEVIPKEEPTHLKEEPSEEGREEDLRELLKRRKRSQCKEEPRPAAPSPSPEMDAKMVEPVMSMHVQDSDTDPDAEFEAWRRKLIAKKKKKKMSMESS